MSNGTVYGEPSPYEDDPDKHYKPTKLALYQLCPKIIKSMRVPGHVHDAMGRRVGEPNGDEVAGANDLLYFLMETDSIAFLANYLGVERQQVFDAIDMRLHQIESTTNTKRGER